MSELSSIRNGLVLDVDFRGYSPRDKSVYGNILTNFGSIWTPNGRVFDGVDDYIDCGNKDNLNTLTTFTFLLFVTLYNFTTSPRIFDKNRKLVFLSGGSNNIINAQITYSNTNASSVTPTIVLQNKEMFLAVTYSEQQDRKIRIYINGFESTYTSQIASIGNIVSDNTNNLIIGNNIEMSRGFNGNIRSFYIFNRVLTNAEIYSIYLKNK